MKGRKYALLGGGRQCRRLGGQGGQLPTPGCRKISNCPPLAVAYLIDKIGENQSGVGSWQQYRRFCPPLAQAERTLLAAYPFKNGFELETLRHLKNSHLMYFLKLRSHCAVIM